MEGGVCWVEFDDVRKVEGCNSSCGMGSGMSFLMSFGFVQSMLEIMVEIVVNVGVCVVGVKSVKVVYIVLINLMLMGLVVMMVLIGCVLIDGIVNDLYFFKVLVGLDNLIVNGIDIFDVVGVVFSGIVLGDWMFLCVCGQVCSIIFVFYDGMICIIFEDCDGNQ